MKTRLLLFSVMVMFSLTSFSQNLEELNKKVEHLTSQISQLQSKITVLEDKIPYYEEVLKLQQTEPVLVNGPYEVRVTLHACRCLSSTVASSLHREIYKFYN